MNDVVDFWTSYYAQEVELRSGLDRYKQFVSYLSTSNDKTAKQINSYQNEILNETPGVERTAKMKALDTVLIQEYLDNSLKTLGLCTYELQNFINSAGNLASCIEEKKSDKMVKEIQVKVENEANEVVKKIDTLIKQHLDTLNKLNTKIEELVQRQVSASIWRRILNVIFISSLSAVFVCSVIMATAMAVPAVAAYLAAHEVLRTIIAAGAVVQTLSPAMKRARACLDKMIKDHESNSNERTDLNGSMRAGTLEIIEELKKIRCDVQNVNPKREGEREGPTEKLKEFKEGIEELKKAIKNCVSVIEKARDEVVSNYEELKRQV